MKARRTNVSVGGIIKGIADEREEQYLAQIAALSCEVSLIATKKGIANYIINSRKKQKTKYEYNQERVRDFRVGKSHGEVAPATVDEVADDLEQHGKASYFLLQTDPPPFVRNYNYSVFEDTLKMLNRQHPHFHSIERLDLSNQAIGDARFVEVCDAIAKSSIKTMNLSGNKLSNTGIQSLSAVLRSMHNLTDLNLSRNKMSDDGISHLCADDAYSGTIKNLDLSFNTINATGAFYLVSMFREDRQCCLESLTLGGKVGMKGWGDEFVKVLMSGVIESAAKKLKRLNIADAGLSEIGLDCITALLSCDETVLEVLNISKNSFATHSSRTNFLNVLRLNKSMREVFIRECGFREVQAEHILSIIRSNNREGEANRLLALHNPKHRQHLHGEYKLTWGEYSALAHCVAASWSLSKHSYHKVKISFIKDNPWRIPGPPLWQVVKHSAYESDMLSNVAAVYHDTQVVLPPSVKYALELINLDLRYADLLREALILSRTMAVDPRTVRASHSSRANNEAIAATVQEIERDVQQIGNAVDTYRSLCTTARDDLFKELEIFKTDSEAVLRVAKRRERKNIQMIITDVSHRMNSDRLLFCAEDYRAAVTEESHALERAIGALHRQRLLYYCLLQENVVRGKEKFDFVAFMRSSIPYYGNLRAAATFVHYFYLTFPNERKDNKKIEEKALQMLQQRLDAGQMGSSTGGEDASHSTSTAPQLLPGLPDGPPMAQKKVKHATRNSKRNNVFIANQQRAATPI